jgi:Uncharacterised nucleotidyltransferase
MVEWLTTERSASGARGGPEASVRVMGDKVGRDEEGGGVSGISESATGQRESRPIRLRDASVALVAEAEANGVVVRVLGGIAVAVRCPSAQAGGPLARDYSDIDLVTTRKHARNLRRIMEEAGYVPNERFNAANGSTRLSFADPAEGVHVDIFVDDFRLCHVLPLADRLRVHPVTIPLEDLLLSKLQVAKLSRKDVTDAVAVLADHELGTEDGIQTGYITALLARDWGWWRTSTETLGRIAGLLDSLDLADADATRVKARLESLGGAVEAAPKGLKWKARARIGERRPWREDPEDVG